MWSHAVLEQLIPNFHWSWQQWKALHQCCESKKAPLLFLITPLGLHPSYTANEVIRNEGGTCLFSQHWCKANDTLSVNTKVLAYKLWSLYLVHWLPMFFCPDIPIENASQHDISLCRACLAWYNGENKLVIIVCFFAMICCVNHLN